MNTFAKIIITIFFAYVFISSMFYIMTEMDDFSVEFNISFLLAFVYCGLAAWFINYLWKN